MEVISITICCVKNVEFITGENLMFHLLYLLSRLADANIETPETESTTTITISRANSVPGK